MYATTAPLTPFTFRTTAAGTPEITGAVVSATVTVNVALDTSPVEPVAVQVTVVEPMPKTLFGGGVQVILAPGWSAVTE